MKALTTRLPWAWLIVHGFKRYELRSSPTRIRGQVAIRSSKVDHQWVRYVRRNFPHIPLPSDAELAGLTHSILGTAEITDCIPIDRVPDVVEGACLRPEDYGDLSYAWVREAAEPLTSPIAWNPPWGAVNWSKVPQHIAQEIESRRSR
jgi:hypothetical protein